MAQKNRAKEKDSAPQSVQKSKNNHLVTYFVIFVFGFLSGIAFTVYKGGPPGSPPSTTAEEQAQQQNDETSQAILKLEAAVTANPENFDTWIQLGHLYYDSNLPDKAIAAYTKSLEFHSGDANLLTDLGVMYRRANQPDKAIELFNQAIEKDPSHLPSRFNKGIVLLHDLDDSKGAIAAWEELLKIDPQAKTGNGQLIREFVDKVQADLAKNK
jgi:cytochrome c-type biogenesis protein CcmH/NrfG